MSEVLTSRQHITSTAGVCGGKPCIAGTRIRVWDVAVFAQAGKSPDEILSDYPHLTLGDVHAALAFFYDNREEIERQANEDEAILAKLRVQMGPGPLEQKLARTNGA